MAERNLAALVAPNDENALFRQRMGESSPHELSRLIPCADQSQAGGR
jgi:hypothetical protein